jgi:hypothetical protein
VIYLWLRPWTTWQKWVPADLSGTLALVCSTPLKCEGDDKKKGSSRGHGVKWGWIRRTGVALNGNFLKDVLFVHHFFLGSNAKYAECKEAPCRCCLFYVLSFRNVTLCSVYKRQLWFLSEYDTPDCLFFWVLSRRNAGTGFFCLCSRTMSIADRVDFLLIRRSVRCYEADGVMLLLWTCVPQLIKQCWLTEQIIWGITTTTLTRGYAVEQLVEALH